MKVARFVEQVILVPEVNSVCGLRADELQQLVTVDRTPLDAPHRLHLLLQQSRVNLYCFLQDLWKHKDKQESGVCLRV